MNGPKLKIYQNNNDNAIEIIQSGTADALKVQGHIVGNSSRSPLSEAIHRHATFGSTTRWEQVAVTFTHGGGSGIDCYHGATFDGRYVYFSPSDSDTFVRYDTTAQFDTTGAWAQMQMNSAQGGAALDNAYHAALFDGRYIYYVVENSSTMIRFDAAKSFTAIASWEQIAMTSVVGNITVPAATYQGCTFDGRYLYLAPTNGDTFVRFDTTQSFTSISSWLQLAIDSGLGAAPPSVAAFRGCTFDSRYVYFAPANSDTFVRFDTTLSFSVISSWQQIAMSSAQGGAAVDQAYTGIVYDGRHIYFAPATSDTFIRFDTIKPFTDVTAWQQIAMSSAQGNTVLDTAYGGATFDGRYVYFSALNSDTFVRYDTTESFTSIDSWEQVAMSSAQGAAAVNTAYNALAFDGYYIYMAPEEADTVIRFRANNTVNPGPAEYAQVSTV